jgi:hypothetical protein
VFKNVETKVIAAAAGSGFGGALGGFVLWLLGVLVWGAPSDAQHAASAATAVPEPVSSLVVVVLAIAGAYLAGYAAPHTVRADAPRPVVDAPPAPAPVEVVADPVAEPAENPPAPTADAPVAPA